MTRPRRLTPSTATISTKAFADRITRPPSDLARMLDRTSKRAVTDADLLPPIPFNFKHRQRDVFIYIVFILACNLAVPCILYYCLVNYTNLSEHALLGIGAASLGISSCVDHPYRSWKLFGHREYYGPLGDDNRWHFDALNHIYSVALLVFAIPLAVATSTEPVMGNFFLMSLPMLVGPVGVILLLTLLPIRVPFWMSSDPPGTRLKPCMFYITEDIGAVDFCHGRIFRMAMNQRYTASPLFRALFWYLTLLWGVACVAFVPLTLAVVLTATFRFAYGFVLGFFFLYLVAVGLVSWALIALFRSKEWQWLQSRKFEMEAEGTAVNIDAGREPATLERMSSLARHTSLPAPKFISSNQPASLSTPPPVVHRRSDPV